MPVTYYGSRISDNIIKLTDGCLLCKNVPIARTGEYKYLGSEMGLDDNDIHSVYRTDEDVFSPKAIASFEGKAFTDNHPSDDVSIDNWAMYSKGEIKNVRRGTGKDSDKLIADIFVRDPIVASEIFSGKREISSGYTCEYVQDSNGKFYQKNIIGNHVALVDNGRAGHTVRINDQDPFKYNKYRFVKKLQDVIKILDKGVK